MISLSGYQKDGAASFPGSVFADMIRQLIRHYPVQIKQDFKNSEWETGSLIAYIYQT